MTTLSSRNLAVSAEIVVFAMRANTLSVLLCAPDRDGSMPWGLPGGTVACRESLEACASRALAAKTGLVDIYLEQLFTFGQPERDPRRRVIAVAYYALLPADRAEALPTHADLDWFQVDDLPPLAFDHDAIVAQATLRLRAKLGYSTIALQLMPRAFTLSELQCVYESILGRLLDKRNFRKQVLGMECLLATGHKRRQGSHRPAMLYQATAPGEVAMFR